MLFILDYITVNFSELKGKKPKKGIKKRSKNEKDNIWWPWASYEDWLKRHEPQVSNAITNDEPKVKSTEKREDKLEKKKRTMKEKKIKEGKGKNLKKIKEIEKVDPAVKRANETSLEKSRNLFFSVNNEPDLLQDQQTNLNQLEYGHKHNRKGFSHDPFFKPQKKNIQYLKRKTILSLESDMDNEIRKFYEQVPSWKKSILKASKRNFTSGMFDTINAF